MLNTNWTCYEYVKKEAKGDDYKVFRDSKKERFTWKVRRNSFTFQIQKEKDILVVVMFLGIFMTRMLKHSQETTF